MHAGQPHPWCLAGRRGGIAMRTSSIAGALAVLVAVASPARSQTCVGDCDQNGVVTITDLLLGVNIVLGEKPVSACPAFENSEGKVDMPQLIKGVNNALEGC